MKVYKKCLDLKIYMDNDVSMLGFYKQLYSVLCGCTGLQDIRKDIKYKVKIEQVKLWLI